MKKIDQVVIEILKKYDERAEDALWDCHGVWVVYHKAIERIAAKAGVSFDMPEIVEANSEKKTVAIVVRGFLEDKAEWSFGEATPANNKNSYPFAMAEKRAKDRVVLKLVGLHGLAYSEEESDDFKPAVEQPKAVSKNEESRKNYSALIEAMRANKSRELVKSWWNDPDCISLRNELPTDWQTKMREEFIEYGKSLPEPEKKAA